ncbi:MAG: CDP-alcohol phosphatidyltransferase family protein [Acidimicrobiales bacterium]
MLRRTLGPFGVKDLFTMVNLLSGVVAVRFALGGEEASAGYAILVGFLLGDILDGVVARRTGTANAFGAEFDAISDHFVHVFVPGVVIYQVYDQAGHADLGFVALAVLVTGATIRHARLAAARFDFPLCWCGLPRTISGFAALSFPLSSTFASTNHAYVLGVVVIAILSALNLAPIPYLTHRGRRSLQLYVKVPVIAFLLSAPVMFVLARRYTFDVFFVGLLAFALGGWLPVHPDERRAFYAEYRRWSAELGR